MNKQVLILLFVLSTSLSAQEIIVSEKYVSPVKEPYIYITQPVPSGRSYKYSYTIVDNMFNTIRKTKDIDPSEETEIRTYADVEELFVISEEQLFEKQRHVTIPWDMKNDRGDTVSEGEYLIQISAISGTIIKKLQRFTHKVIVDRTPNEFEIQLNSNSIILNPGAALIVNALDKGNIVTANKWWVTIKNEDTPEVFRQQIAAPSQNEEIGLQYDWNNTEKMGLGYFWNNFEKINEYGEYHYTISVENEDRAGNHFGPYDVPFSVIYKENRESELNGELEFYRKAIDIKESEYREELARLNAELDAYKGVSVKDDGSVAMESPGTQDNQIFYHIQIYSRNGNNNSSHFPIDESRLVETEGYYEFYHKTTGYAFFVYATRGNYNAVSAPSHFTRIFDWSGFSHKALEVLVEKAVIQTLLTRKEEVIKLQAVLKNKLVVPRELSVLK
ncbi:MAG: hypothetical protein LBU84_08690 [Prevotella sp.]|jgi:hypothetical protein|nr:hypothetical protein [Prevotella sp.]